MHSQLLKVSRGVIISSLGANRLGKKFACMRNGTCVCFVKCIALQQAQSNYQPELKGLGCQGSRIEGWVSASHLGPYPASKPLPKPYEVFGWI